MDAPHDPKGKAKFVVVRNNANRARSRFKTSVFNALPAKWLKIFTKTNAERGQDPKDPKPPNGKV